MHVSRRLYFSFILSGLVLSLPAKSMEHQAPSATESASEESGEKIFLSDSLSNADLKIYLELLEQREKQLTAANDSLLKNANYSLVKIPLFMVKAALDGYLTAQMGGNSPLPKLAASQMLAWLKTGGIEKLKSLGFNVGILGITAASNSALQPNFRWQYVIPIYGGAYSAYLWSEQLMSTPDLIKKNGDAIIQIRREKYKVRALLEKGSH
ncbi:hypothetical protein EBT16_05840 [bacterium]|nr:hypothetical protein [bacterium]